MITLSPSACASQPPEPCRDLHAGFRRGPSLLVLALHVLHRRVDLLDRRLRILAHEVLR
jgi:hypothetical protein